MSAPANSMLDRYLRHRRIWEIALWTTWYLLDAAGNSVVVLMDFERRDLSVDWWEPVVWEYSSALMLLALVPAQLAFDHRFPFRAATWRRAVAAHLIATIPYSLIHVFGMVGLRHLAYGAVASRYEFGYWPKELLYEYLKDVRTYAYTVTVIYLYRLLLLRLRGEARLLTAPDTGPPAEAIERPSRFLVRKLGAEFLVAAHDIEFLEAAENYVNLHVRGRVYPLRSTMTAIQDRLDPARFVRVHRSYIVNLDFLDQIEPLDTGDARLLLKNGSRVPCSRRYRSALRQQ
ncbi:MAG TPA: LytTR family DNA-binding domain-containing protein [Steroidobacteraceae bacterium]|jgi:LytTr DNA-binding domain-containing protein|nr:LytTR family DNA-binding domain-containing protein [Steroidobacteraceae bacterium]